MEIQSEKDIYEAGLQIADGASNPIGISRTLYLCTSYLSSQKKDTRYIKEHPGIRLIVAQLNSICGLGGVNADSVWSQAYYSCKEIVFYERGK
jgi:hypothetical protein